MKITVDQIMAWKPCSDYPRERVIELWDGRDGLTMLEILDLDIPAEDRVWVACQDGALPLALRDRWLDGIVTRAVTDHALTCGIPKVESWARAWIDGTDRTAGAASAAAWAASAADWAAWAARDAARDAAESAAWAAAGAAAWGAAAAAAAAAADTERQRQIEDLRILLKSEDEL